MAKKPSVEDGARRWRDKHPASSPTESVATAVTLGAQRYRDRHPDRITAGPADEDNVTFGGDAA
jgi:hypothetical protein